MYPTGSHSLFSNTYFIILLTFIMTILTYYLAENRIRKMNGKKIVIILLILMGIVGIVSVPMRVIRQKQYYNQDDYEVLQFIKLANKQMVPQKQDYVTISNRKYPNFSINKNRVPATDIKKIKAPFIDAQHDALFGKQMLLQQFVKDVDSQYLQMVHTRQRQCCIDFFQMTQGNEKQLFIIGDSHAGKMTYRFNQLHNVYKKKNMIDKYPTVLVALRTGNIFSQSNQLISFTHKLIDKYHPQRILLAWHWLLYFCKDLDGELQELSDCNEQLMKVTIKSYVKFIHDLQEKGVEVYSVGVDIVYKGLSPFNMVDGNGVIQQNIKPFKHSLFRNKYKIVIDYVQHQLNVNKIKWRDMSDNLCWQDQCHVVSSKGYGGYRDSNHLGKFYSKYYFTIFDDLVQFD